SSMAKGASQMTLTTHVARAGGALALAASLLWWLPVQQVTAQTSVGTEAQLRAAMADPSSNGAILTGDITLTDCTGVPAASVRRPSGSTNFVLEGNHHTIRQTCPNGSVLFYESDTGTFTVDDVIVTGGHSNNDAAGIMSSAPLTIDRSTISGNSGNIG